MQLLWLLVVAGQAALAAFWWWMTPAGFPSTSSEYWAGYVVPAVIIAVCVLALAAPKKITAALFPALAAAIPCFWMTLAISARLTFPRSVGFSWNVTFLACCALLALWWKQLRPRLEATWLVPVLVLPALWAGWAFPSTQRAAEPSTTPRGDAIVDLAKTKDTRLVKIGKNVQLHPSEARVVVRRDELLLTVEPLLRFLDLSPERTWVGLSAPEDTKPAVRKLIATAFDKSRWQLEYTDDGKSLLDVTQRDGALAVDARSSLSAPVYSHENAWAELTLRGDKKLSVAFSPAPAQRIEVPAAGAPTRFAYVDATGRFHVAEAKERKLGPYRELTAGDLKGPLVITIYDGDQPAFRVTLEDWATQASTALSPTSALPENAIELARAPGGDDAPAYLLFTLASTRIGRTTQTVGHTAGVYRDRMTIAMP